MELSGTSFAAPVVSGIAADLLGVHPDWTPDQVKGALMRSATALKKAAPLSVGVGEVNIQKALDDKTPPPNPNAGLEQFLVPDPDGGRVPGLRLGELAQGGAGQRVLEQRLLGQRLLEHGVLELGFLEQRLVEQRLVPERVLEHARPG